jgi:hypothetical protein
LRAAHQLLDRPVCVVESLSLAHRAAFGSEVKSRSAGGADSNDCEQQHDEKALTQ